MRQGDREGVRHGMAAGSMGMAVAEDLDRYESTLRAQGFVRIAGRRRGRTGSSSPVRSSPAAVVLPDDFDRHGHPRLRSSSPRKTTRRCSASGSSDACVYTIRKIDAQRDRQRVGLHRSNLALLRRCVRALDPVPDYVLTDGFPVAKMPCPALGVKKGDMVAAMHRGGVDRCEGHPRPHHAASASPLSRVRSGAQQGLRHPGTPGRRCNDSVPPPMHRLELRRGRPALLAGARASGSRNEREHGSLMEDDIERF